MRIREAVRPTTRGPACRPAGLSVLSTISYHNGQLSEEKLKFTVKMQTSRMQQ